MSDGTRLTSQQVTFLTFPTLLIHVSSSGTPVHFLRAPQIEEHFSVVTTVRLSYGMLLQICQVLTVTGTASPSVVSTHIQHCTGLKVGITLSAVLPLPPALLPRHSEPRRPPDGPLIPPSALPKTYCAAKAAVY